MFLYMVTVFTTVSLVCYLQQTVQWCVSSTVDNISLCSMLQEDVDNPVAAVCTGVVQRGVLLLARSLGVSSCLQQLLNDAKVESTFRRPLGS